MVIKIIESEIKIKQDWHIHSYHSCDCDGIYYGMNLDDLPAEAEQIGILQYGISDHIHTDYNKPDLISSKKHYDLVLSRNPDLKGKFHFGVEVSCMSEWELEKIRNGDYSGDIIYGIRKGGPPNTKPAITLDKHDIDFTTSSDIIRKAGIDLTKKMFQPDK